PSRFRTLASIGRLRRRRRRVLRRRRQGKGLAQGGSSLLLHRGSLYQGHCGEGRGAEAGMVQGARGSGNPCGGGSPGLTNPKRQRGQDFPSLPSLTFRVGGASSTSPRSRFGLVYPTTLRAEQA